MRPMSQPPTEMDDDDEFAALLGNVTSKLEKRTDSIRDIKTLSKQHKDDPDLVTVQSCIADVKAGREDPRKSELWPMGVVN